jgi:nucleotide-binding universal stress UspA family protein
MVMSLQTASYQEFMSKVFLPKASSSGAQVVAHVLHCYNDGASDIGAAICDFVETNQPSAVVLMRKNKSPVISFFMGSVTKYCATHSQAPVVIVPA